MRPEYYADLCRQYATFLRSYAPELQPYKIATGASVADYNWTRTVVEMAWRQIDAISLHHYSMAGPSPCGSATDFSRRELYDVLRSAMRMEELVDNHSRLIKMHGHGKQIGLVVDEWGTWFEVEPGTNPGFLYQQNTMRDALVAALTLNIFNNHCDTVVMANIAQVANVLQAMILTEGDKLLLTPTYHVFRMYKAHQNACQLESYAETRLLEGEAEGLPDLQVSASRQADGRVLVTAAHLDDAASLPVTVRLGGVRPAAVQGLVLAGAPGAHNTFEAPAAVAPRPLNTLPTDDGFTALLPPCSVAAFTLTQA